MDGSNIYGSTDQDLAQLKAATGRLKISTTSGQAADFLPSCRSAATAKLEACEACETDPEDCFVAGDVRVNEQPNLVVLHTVFMREHNRLADILAGLNPGWRPERLFQVKICLKLFFSSSNLFKACLFYKHKIFNINKRRGINICTSPSSE